VSFTIFQTCVSPIRASNGSILRSSEGIGSGITAGAPTVSITNKSSRSTNS